MDKVTKYKRIAHEILDEVLEMMKNIDNTEVFEVNEIEKGHFLLMTDGWDGVERSYGPLVHIEVKNDGKVWLRQDGTDLEIGQILLDKGVSADDIVLAFYSPSMRKYTNFAVA
jgi:XisI protein